MIYANGQLIDNFVVKNRYGSTTEMKNVTCYKQSTGKKHYVYYDYDVGLYVNKNHLQITTGPYIGKVGVFCVTYQKQLFSRWDAWVLQIGEGSSVINQDFPDSDLKGAYALVVYFHPFCSDSIIKAHMNTLNAMAADTSMNKTLWSYNYDYLKTPGRTLGIADYTGRGYVTAADCNEQVFGFICIPTFETSDSGGKIRNIDFIHNWYNAQ